MGTGGTALDNKGEEVKGANVGLVFDGLRLCVGCAGVGKNNPGEFKFVNGEGVDVCDLMLVDTRVGRVGERGGMAGGALPNFGDRGVAGDAVR